MSERLDTTRSGLWRAALALGIILLGGLLRVWLLGALDLRDTPGANGVRVIARAAAGLADKGWATWFVVWAMPLVDGDPARAAHIVSVLASLAMVIGAALGGAALGGRWGATAAATVAATWTLSVEMALLVGPDPLSAGIAWLAVGLVWAGFSRSWVGSPLIAAGSLLLPLAVSTKESALPAVALLALGPVLARWRWSTLIHLVSLGLGTWWGFRFFGYPRMVHAASLPLDLRSVWGGIMQVAHLSDMGMPEGRLARVLGAAVVGAVLPGPRLLRRLLVALGALSVLGLTASSTGELLRPRYLVAASFGVLVVAGVGVGVGARLLQRLLRGTPVVQPLVLVLLGALVSLDTLAFTAAWAQQRTAMTGARAASLPPVPASWVQPYLHMPSHLQRDLTIYGAVELYALVAQGQPVAMPPLRDQRENHLIAAGRSLGVSVVVLYPDACCTQGPSGCAARTVRQVRDAGMVLALPVQSKKVTRVDRRDQVWVAALRAAADLEPYGDWWETQAAAAVSQPRATPCLRAPGRNLPDSERVSGVVRPGPSAPKTR